MSDDGSITLPPNPFGTAATWADYDWRALARTYGETTVAGKVFALIADALAPTPDPPATEERAEDDVHEAVLDRSGTVCTICGRWESNGVHS